MRGESKNVRASGTCWFSPRGAWASRPLHSASRRETAGQHGVLGGMPRTATETVALPGDRAASSWMLRTLLFIALAGGLSMGNLHAGVPAPARLTATLDRQTISAGETAQLSLTFEGGTPDVPPPISGGQGLTVQFAGTSQQISIVNGRTSASTSYNYRITAAQPGQFTIPAIRAMVNGGPVTSQPLTLSVVKGEAPGAGLESQAQLKLIVAKPAIYLGESIPIEVQLYFQNGQDIQMPKLPGEGFTIGTFPQPKQSRVVAGGAAYNVLSFRAAATPLKPGKLTLGPAECVMVLRLPQTGRRTDPFDAFGDFIGSRTELRSVTLQSNPVQLEVLPLPEANRPPSFGGAIGSFTLAVTSSPKTVSVGDPITLNIQLSGAGALDALSIPESKEWREFKTYPPASRVEVTDDIGLAGTKTFEWVVVPQNSEIKQLPAIEFSYFDPNTKSYQTLRHSPMPVTVKPAAVAPAPTLAKAGAPSTPPPPARDLLHIKPNLGELAVVTKPLLPRGWFLALQALPPILFAAALLWRRHAEKIAGNPLLQRRSRTSRLVRNGLQLLRLHASANRSEEFFATLFRLLQEQIGSNLDLPASAITEAVLDERLGSGLASPTLLGELHSLFALCNQARYSPDSVRQNLSALLPQIESALRALEKLNSKAPAHEPSVSAK